MSNPKKTKGKIYARQGDVALLYATPKAVTTEHQPVDRDEHGRLILALGEASGHAHVFRDPGVCMLRREGVSDRVVTLDFETQLLHDEGSTAYVPTGEHGPIAVPPKTWIVRQQREWSGEQVRNASD